MWATEILEQKNGMISCGVYQNYFLLWLELITNQETTTNIQVRGDGFSNHHDSMEVVNPLTFKPFKARPSGEGEDIIKRLKKEIVLPKCNSWHFLAIPSGCGRCQWLVLFLLRYLYRLLETIQCLWSAMPLTEPRPINWSCMTLCTSLWFLFGPLSCSTLFSWAGYMGQLPFIRPHFPYRKHTYKLSFPTQEVLALSNAA